MAWGLINVLKVNSFTNMAKKLKLSVSFVQVYMLSLTLPKQWFIPLALCLNHFSKKIRSPDPNPGLVN